MKRVKLGVVGIALVILLVVSLVLSALFCAFPWCLTIRRAAAEVEAPAKDGIAAQGDLLAQRTNPDVMTIIYADDDSTEAREQIDAANAKLIQAWKIGDAELFASCFAEDGVYMLPGQPPVLGREAVLTRMKDVFSRVRLTEGKMTTIDFYLLGTTAYETGKSEISAGPIGKKPKKESGRYVSVWRKEGTKWKMWRAIGVPKG